jgi:uncharacterized protein YcbK (DUF882 family)
MKLTKNFSIGEFNSKDGSQMPAVVRENIEALAKNLQALREFFGAEISINSGYRSPAHNEAVGGASKSQHLKGTAADIVVEGITPDQVADTIEKLITEGKMKQGGIGRYNSFTHYDIRGEKARWDFRK